MVFRVPHKVGVLAGNASKGVTRTWPASLLTPRHHVAPGVKPGGAAASEANFYQDIVDAGLTSGLVCCLDAGSIISNPGSGDVWIDLSPAGNDFNASGTGEPEPIGTPGGLSSSEYFETDGTNYFQAATIPQSIKDCHKEGAQFTFLLWIYNPGMPSNRGYVTTINGSVVNGVSWRTAATNSHMLEVEKLSGGHCLVKGPAGTTTPTSQWNLCGLSIDENAGAAGGFFYLNGAYIQVSSSDTWDPSYSSPSSTDATGWQIGVWSQTGSGPLASGGRLGGLFCWAGETPLTKANCDTIWDATKGRWGL